MIFLTNEYTKWEVRYIWNSGQSSCYHRDICPANRKCSSWGHIFRRRLWQILHTNEPQTGTPLNVLVSAAQARWYHTAERWARHQSGDDWFFRPGKRVWVERNFREICNTVQTERTVQPEAYQGKDLTYINSDDLYWLRRSIDPHNLLTRTTIWLDGLLILTIFELGQPIDSDNRLTWRPIDLDDIWTWTTYWPRKPFDSDDLLTYATYWFWWRIDPDDFPRRIAPNNNDEVSLDDFSLTNFLWWISPDQVLGGCSTGRQLLKVPKCEILGGSVLPPSFFLLTQISSAVLLLHRPCFSSDFLSANSAYLPPTPFLVAGINLSPILVFDCWCHGTTLEQYRSG